MTVYVAQSEPVLKPWQFPVSAYGAAGNAVVLSDVATTASSAVITEANGGFATAVAGQSILIWRGGSSGVMLATTILSVQSSNQVTLSTDILSGQSDDTVIFGTDDTAAIKAAIAAANAYALNSPSRYAEILFDAHKYMVAGALDTSQSGSAQLAVPYTTDSVHEITLVFRGAGDVVTPDNWALTQTNPLEGAPVSGTVLCSGITGAAGVGHSVIGCQTAGLSTSTFQPVKVVIDGLCVEACFPLSSSDGVMGFDLRGASEAWVRNAAMFPAGLYHGLLSSVGTAANDGFVGLAMPLNDNSEPSAIDYYACARLYGGVWISEHTQINGYLAVQECYDGVGVVGAYYHGARISYASLTWCQNPINSNPSGQYVAGPSGSASMRLIVDHLDLEDGGYYSSPTHINDPGDYLLGVVNFNRVHTVSGDEVGLTVAGATGMKIRDISRPPGAVTAPTMVAASSALTNPFWRDAAVVVSGGTSVAISVSGVATGLSGGTVLVPSGQAISLGAYTGSPTWVWTLL